MLIRDAIQSYVGCSSGGNKTSVRRGKKTVYMNDVMRTGESRRLSDEVGVEDLPLLWAQRAAVPGLLGDSDAAGERVPVPVGGIACLPACGVIRRFFISGMVSPLW